MFYLCTSGKELPRDGPGGPGGQQGDREAAVCPGGQEGQWCHGWPTVGHRVTVRQQCVLVAKRANGVVVGQRLANG